jgi:hypothetical protein
VARPFLTSVVNTEHSLSTFIHKSVILLFFTMSMKCYGGSVTTRIISLSLSFIAGAEPPYHT